MQHGRRVGHALILVLATAAAAQDVQVEIPPTLQPVPRNPAPRVAHRADSPIVEGAMTGAFPDCNANGIDDADDIANCDGSPDCVDCNANSTLDQCEIERVGTQLTTVPATPETIIESPEGYPPGILISTLGEAPNLYHVAPEDDEVTVFASDLLFTSIGMVAAPNEFEANGASVFVTTWTSPDVLALLSNGSNKGFGFIDDFSFVSGIEYLPVSVGGPHAGKLVATSQRNSSGHLGGAIYSIDSAGFVTTLVPDLTFGVFTVHLAPPEFGVNGSRLFAGNADGFEIITFDPLTDDVAIFATVPQAEGTTGLRHMAFAPVGWFKVLGDAFAAEPFLVVSMSAGQNKFGAIGTLAVVNVDGETVARLPSRSPSSALDPRGMYFDGDTLLLANASEGEEAITVLSAEDFIPLDCNRNGFLDECEGEHVSAGLNLSFHYPAFRWCMSGPSPALMDMCCDGFDVESNHTVDLRDFADFQCNFTGE